MSIKNASLALAMVSSVLMTQLHAAEPGEQAATPQSHEAIKQMADQLEADRKAREKEYQEKKAAEEREAQEAAEQDEQELQGVGEPIDRRRPLLPGRPRPTPH